MCWPGMYDKISTLADTVACITSDDTTQSHNDAGVGCCQRYMLALRRLHMQQQLYEDLLFCQNSEYFQTKIIHRKSRMFCPNYYFSSMNMKTDSSRLIWSTGEPCDLFFSPKQQVIVKQYDYYIARSF